MSFVSETDSIWQRIPQVGNEKVLLGKEQRQTAGGAEPPYKNDYAKKPPASDGWALNSHINEHYHLFSSFSSNNENSNYKKKK